MGDVSARMREAGLSMSRVSQAIRNNELSYSPPDESSLTFLTSSLFTKQTNRSIINLTLIISNILQWILLLFMVFKLKPSGLLAILGQSFQKGEAIVITKPPTIPSIAPSPLPIVHLTSTFQIFTFTMITLAVVGILLFLYTRCTTYRLGKIFSQDRHILAPSQDTNNISLYLQITNVAKASVIIHIKDFPIPLPAIRYSVTPMVDRLKMGTLCTRILQVEWMTPFLITFRQSKQTIHLPRSIKVPLTLYYPLKSILDRTPFDEIQYTLSYKVHANTRYHNLPQDQLGLDDRVNQLYPTLSQISESPKASNSRLPSAPNLSPGATRPFTSPQSNLRPDTIQPIKTSFEPRSSPINITTHPSDIDHTIDRPPTPHPITNKPGFERLHAAQKHLRC